LLIPRLGSNFEGEVIATVRAIRRLLEAGGSDLHDLAKVVGGGSLIVNRDESPDGIITLAEDMLKCSWLSNWEREFLGSIRDQARRRYGFKLSEKQRAQFEKLLRRAGKVM